MTRRLAIAYGGKRTISTPLNENSQNAISNLPIKI